LQPAFPFQLGGLGLRSSQHSAKAAFLGVCNSAHVLMSGSSDFFMSLPGKECAISFFEHQSLSLSNDSSQNELKYMLHNMLFQQLLEHSTIHDQACLRGLSHSSGTSSGWLKALP